MKTKTFNRIRSAAALVALSFGGFLPDSALAALTVSPIFGSNMVLQRNTTVPVFGTADPGATVTVQFQGQNRSDVADGNGSWQVDLSSMPASSSPGTMTVSSGTDTVVLTDVQVGEVWLCSGQSNMGWPLSNANGGDAAIAESGGFNIRLFRMTGGSGPETTTWQVANPGTTPNFSAVGWWMGRELSQWFGNVAIGLIQATHDGTAISQWQHTSGGNGADYDAMVRAIQPFAIQGVAWYQGESNGGDGDYAEKLTNMINEWRGDWGLSTLPFGIIQLAYRSQWNVCRNAQLEVADTLPDCYLVVIRDLPGGTLHPTEKKPVGIRTAIGARGLVYGDSITYSGPIRDIGNSFVSGDTVILHWKHVGNGLFTDDGQAPGGFKLAAATGQFKNADAVIVGDTVQVTSSSVSSPRRVQYAYSSIGNLYNLVSIPTEGGAVMVDRLKASEFEIEILEGGGDTTPPAAPTGLVATGGDGTASLDWNDNTEPDLAGYNVKRSTTSGGPYSTIATGVGDSAYTDNPVNNGTTYYYVVSAMDTSANESANSSEAAVTPTGGGGCTPGILFVASITTTTVNVGQGNKIGRAQVLVQDNCGNPVSGATVTGTFTGSYNETRSGVTDGGGVAIIDTVESLRGGVSFTFCADAVTGSLPYDSGSNMESCDSL